VKYVFLTHKMILTHPFE